jgi:hypothetical protein
VKSFLKVLLTLALLAALCVFVGYRWWQQPGPGTTSIRLTGTPGDSFTGSYVRDGKRVGVRGVLPWNIEDGAISEAEFRKSRADEALQVEARHFKKHGFNAMVTGPVKPEFAGMRVRVHHAGIGMEPLK